MLYWEKIIYAADGIKFEPVPEEGSFCLMRMESNDPAKPLGAPGYFYVGAVFQEGAFTLQAGGIIAVLSCRPSHYAVVTEPSQLTAARSTQEEVEFTQFVEDYIKTLKWSDNTPENARFLAEANIRGFAGHVRRTLLKKQ